MSIENNGFIFLGNIEPGGSEYTAGYDYTQQTIVSFNIDPALAANLQVQADDFRGTATLPISSLSWQVAYAQANIGIVPWVTALSATYQTQAFASGVPATIYSYPGSVLNYTGGFQFNFLWHIAVPQNQQSGSYYTNVWFTLTQ